MTPGQLYVSISTLSAKDAVELINETKLDWETAAIEQYKEDCKPNIQLVNHPFSNIKNNE